MPTDCPFLWETHDCHHVGTGYVKAVAALQSAVNKTPRELGEILATHAGCLSDNLRSPLAKSH